MSDPNRCDELGLLERHTDYIRIDPEPATLQELLSIHSATYIDLINSTFPTTIVEVALLACGGTIDLVKGVAEGELQNGMAIIRPPGHNALRDECSGFCYLNNVGIAAKEVLRTGLAKQILIVDFDLRHGHGTQQAFYKDPR